MMTCRWIPNTLDRVRVHADNQHVELNISDISQVLGREALEGLYLRGTFTLDPEDDRYWTAVTKLFERPLFVGLAAD